jgi:4-aminobutyrate aminotransferase/(S)-3-amino-2-methylpropionate transaminase
MPLGAVTGRAEIMDASGPGGLGSTFGGNPLSCAAALAAWRTLDELNLSQRAERLGQIFERVTGTWKERFPMIGDIRGVGAMRAIELVRDRATREPAKQETQRVLADCHRRGLIILSAGTYGNVIRILVPLVATDPMMEEGLSVLETALAWVQQNEAVR